MADEAMLMAVLETLTLNGEISDSLAVAKLITASDLSQVDQSAAMWLWGRLQPVGALQRKDVYEPVLDASIPPGVITGGDFAAFYLALKRTGGLATDDEAPPSPDQFKEAAIHDAFLRIGSYIFGGGSSNDPYVLALISQINECQAYVTTQQSASAEMTEATKASRTRS